MDNSSGRQFKLRFLPISEESKEIIVKIGKKHILDLTLKGAKTWRSILKHLGEKWKGIENFPDSLYIHYLPQDESLSENLIGTSRLDEVVWQTLQEHPTMKQQEESNLFEVFYHIQTPSSSNAIKNTEQNHVNNDVSKVLAAPEDSLWNLLSKVNDFSAMLPPPAQSPHTQSAAPNSSHFNQQGYCHGEISRLAMEISDSVLCALLPPPSSSSPSALPTVKNAVHLAHSSALSVNHLHSSAFKHITDQHNVQDTPTTSHSSSPTPVTTSPSTVTEEERCSSPLDSIAKPTPSSSSAMGEDTTTQESYCLDTLLAELTTKKNKKKKTKKRKASPEVNGIDKNRKIELKVTKDLKTSMEKEKRAEKGMRKIRPTFLAPLHFKDELLLFMQRIQALGQDT